MRLGVLDIGSNSAQLQVVDAYAGAPPLPAHAVKEPTLLADEIQPDGSISVRGLLSNGLCTRRTSRQQFRGSLNCRRPTARIYGEFPRLGRGRSWPAR